MSAARSFFEAFRPWAGLVLGILAVGFVHQVGSDSLFNNCRAVTPLTVLLIGLAGLTLCGLSGFASWHSARSGRGAQRVIGVVSVGSSALFALAIALPMIAALVLPLCFQ